MGAEHINRRLLVMDDEQGVTDAYKAILSPRSKTVQVRSSRQLQAVAKAEAETAAQFEVEYVDSGEKALETIKTSIEQGRPFVGGFFDVKLKGGIDGIETIRRAKDLDPNLLCVVVTAYQDRSIEDITKVFGDGFSDRWDFLAKPFTAAEIRQKAYNLIADWGRRKREKELLEEVKQQQELLVKNERLAAAGTLARGIGHEFGNILLSIMGNSELAVQGEDPEEMLDALKLVSKSAERAGVIVRNLQKLVSVESTRVALPIDGPIRASVPLIGHELKRWNITLSESYPDSPPLVEVNEVEIGQVVLNMLINAVHALQPDGGEIQVKVAAKNDGAMLSISDTGSGISSEHLERIFEPLFTTKGGKGSGIGLAVSKKIVENHGGTIEVQSEVGKGTCFNIWLPKAGSR